MGVCKFSDCEKEVVNIRGYCPAHYQQLRKNNYNKSRLTPLQNKNSRDLYYNKVLECYSDLKTREEVGKRHRLIGIVHFTNPYFDENCGRWYIFIFYNDSDKRIKLSFTRHLMGLKECRRLKNWEHVDHIDEDRQNDYIDNLQILTKSKNSIKSNKYRNKNSPPIIYKFTCPVCGEFTKKRLREVSKRWNKAGSGPTCSPKCGHILMNCKSLNSGKFKSISGDIVGRFIEGKETKEDKELMQVSVKDLELIKKWRLYFEDKKLVFQERIEYYNNLDNQPIPSDAIINLSKELLNYYKNDLDFCDNFYRVVKNKLSYLTENEQTIFIYITLYQLDREHNVNMSYSVYKYLDL